MMIGSFLPLGTETGVKDATDTTGTASSEPTAEEPGTASSELMAEEPGTASSEPTAEEPKTETSNSDVATGSEQPEGKVNPSTIELHHPDGSTNLGYDFFYCCR